MKARESRACKKTSCHPDGRFCFAKAMYRRLTAYSGKLILNTDQYVNPRNAAIM